MAVTPPSAIAGPKRSEDEMNPLPEPIAAKNTDTKMSVKKAETAPFSALVIQFAMGPVGDSPLAGASLTARFCFALDMAGKNASQLVSDLIDGPKKLHAPNKVEFPTRKGFCEGSSISVSTPEPAPECVRFDFERDTPKRRQKWMNETGARLAQRLSELTGAEASFPIRWAAEQGGNGAQSIFGKESPTMQQLANRVCAQLERAELSVAAQGIYGAQNSLDAGIQYFPEGGAKRAPRSL